MIQGLLFFLAAFLWVGFVPSGFAQAPRIVDASLPVAADASLIQQSRRLYEAGELEQAATVLRQAIDTYQAQGDALNSALALRNLALVYEQLGQWPEATAAIADSLAQLSAIAPADRLPVLARTLDLQGHLELTQGHPESALRSWEAAAEIYTQLEDADRLLRNQLSQAQALQAMGQYRRAIITLTDLTQTLETQPDSDVKAIALQQLGNALQVAGDLPQAGPILRTSQAIAQRLALFDTLSSTQLSLGNLAQAQGDLPQALRYYRQAAAQEVASLKQVQAQLGELNLLIRDRQWSQAEALAAQVEQRLPTLPLTQAAIYAQINLADSRLKLARRDASALTYQAPLREAPPQSTAPSAPLTRYTRDNLDLIDLFVGRNAPSVNAADNLPEAGPVRRAGPSGTYTRETVDLVDSFLGGRSVGLPDRLQGVSAGAVAPTVRPDIPGDTYTRDNLNLVDLFLGLPTLRALEGNRFGQPVPSPTATLPEMATGPVSNATLAEIAQLLQTARQDAQVLGDARSESYAWGNLGKVYEQAQQWPDARALSKKALLIAQTLNAPEIAYRWQWQLGRILKAESEAQDPRNPDYSQAIVAYSEAVETLRSLRSDLVTINPEIQVAFQESVEPIHRELVSLLLSQGDQTTPEQLEKARNVLESLQIAELDNFFREACVDINPVLIDQIDRQAAVFYPIPLPDRLEVILRLPGQPLQHYSTPVPQPQLEATVSRLREALVQQSSRRYLPVSQQVYDWLIRPMAAELARNDIQTLVFVADGVLRNIPMAALHDGQQFLIEQYAIALTPGLQLLEPNPITRQDLSVLTAGLTEARQGFPALPNVGPEIEQIQTQLPTPKNLLNQDFTQASFSTAIRNLDTPIVHLATHGQFSSNFEETFILTWNDRLSVYELRDLLESTGLEQSASGVVELLVLSACETAVGDNQAALGLAGTAVQAGARSTVGSLWQVSDEATAMLISQFYTELASGEVTKAEALRRAQQSLLAVPRFRAHPFFWAPYVLLGNWL